MVKSIKLWKLDFYKNDDANGGAMAEAIKHCPANNIVIHTQTKKNGRAWGYIEPTKFLALLEKNHGLYEVITQFPHKVFFDIDKKTDLNDGKAYLENVKKTIETFFPNAEFAVSGSFTETKISFHITLSNYLIQNQNERQQMKLLNKHIRETIDDSFDHTVYTKNRNMKAINQSKDDGRVQQIIENDDYKAHCITCFINENVLPFPTVPEPVQEAILISKSSKTFDIGELPKLALICPDDVHLSNITPEQVLSLLPNTSACIFSYRHLVCRFCATNDISFEMFFAWIVQRFNGKYNKEEKLKQWRSHWNNIHKFPPASIDKLKAILIHFYPHINKDIHFRKFSQTFELPTERIEKIETINKSCFHTPQKYAIFNVGMGGGKTAQTISYVKSQSNFLWIAPNKALATNTKKRFEVEDIDVCHYEEMATKDKKAGKLQEKEKLIICLNSIHYIENTQYDVLVIDEIETLIDKFLGDFLEQGKLQLKNKIWSIFKQLFINAKKVILLDAFITTKTIKLIEAIQPNVSYSIFERSFEPQTRTIKYMDDFTAMLKDIIDKLNEGQKLFIFYPYKKRSGDFMSMEQLFEAITTTTGKTGIFYNADVSDETKGGLRDVNASWGDKQFILTNNIITCGVNYENLDFDYKYICIASHNTPRDIIQVSYRARHLNSGIIKVCYLGKMNQPNTWLNDCVKMNCPIYKIMYNEILIEKKAPLKRSFQMFCVKAHYKQKTDDFKINEEVRKELTKIVESQQCGVSYDSIPDIDFSQAEIIENKCFAQQATMMEKYALNKYYFKKSFTEEASDKLGDIWDENYNFFFKRLAQVLSNEKHLFHQIAVDNKLKQMFPVDIKKTKLSKEIKDEIFNQFSFKYITSLSSTPKILKEIYNTYFNKRVINTQYDNDKNQNVEYLIDDAVYEYYELAKQTLILDSLTYMTYNNLHPEEEASIEV
jgi:hypothetical protein